MKMNKIQEITPVFTEELPYKKDMEFGKIYISREHEVACFWRGASHKLHQGITESVDIY